MLSARVTPPLPDGGLPYRVLFDMPQGQHVVELVTPPDGLLVRRLAADLGDLGYEVAWIRPMPFEADSGSLASLLLMALTRARGTVPGRNEPVMMVVESPSAAQAEAVLDQLLVPGVPEPFGPSVVLVVNCSQSYRRRHPDMTLLHVDIPALHDQWLHRLAPAQHGTRAPIRRQSFAAQGRPGLIDGALRSMQKIGAAELGMIAARAGEPSAQAHALAQSLLEDAPAMRLAALEMAGHLGYAHARFGSLEPAVAEFRHPWWVPLANGWWQVDPAWRSALVSCAARAGTARAGCLSKLVAELVEAGAIHEGIELCLNAGWPGLAADLLAGEVETLLSTGRQFALTCWLERMPTGETRSHPSLARLVTELIPAMPGPSTRPGAGVELRDGAPTPDLPAPQRRRWFSRRPNHSVATISLAPVLPTGATADQAGDVTAAPPVAEVATDSTIAPAVASSDGLAAHPEIDVGGELGPHGGRHPPTRVQARLLGKFEFVVAGEPVPHWRGNRGRMLLAFLLLHRARPLSRDELGGVFWPDAAPEVVRNRLHVALYGLRKDLRDICQEPIVVHGQGGFSLASGIDLWLDVEGFDQALRLAKTEQAHSQKGALKSYEAALQLYRGELLQDAPFEEWTLVRREQIRLQYLDALDQLARLRFAVGRYADCLDICQRLIPGDLCREDIHRLMMRCYTRLNQPHLAIRQYHQCERELRDELGMAPATATQHLYEQIRRRELV